MRQTFKTNQTHRALHNDNGIGPGGRRNIINTCAPNRGAPQYIQQTWTGWKKQKIIRPWCLYLQYNSISDKEGEVPLPFKWLLVPIHGMAVGKELEPELFAPHFTIPSMAVVSSVRDGSQWSCGPSRSASALVHATQGLLRLGHKKHGHFHLFSWILWGKPATVWRHPSSPIVRSTWCRSEDYCQWPAPTCQTCEPPQKQILQPRQECIWLHPAPANILTRERHPSQNHEPPCSRLTHRNHVIE